MNVFNMKAARRLFAALALAMATGMAAAGPLYHVSIDTSAFSGTGWLDLQFNPGFDGTPATATLSNFSGALAAGMTPEVQGAVGSSLPGPVTFANSTAFNALFQAVQLGGILGFDLEFLGTSSVFSVGLYGGDQVTALGNPDPFTNSLVTFELGQGADIHDPALVTVAEVVAVPEPPVCLLMAAALAAIALIRWRA